MKERLEMLKSLTWLADAPLFIDRELVGRFYDAVVHPRFIQGKTTEQITEADQTKIKAALGIDAKIGLKLPAWLSWLGVKAEATGKASVEGEKGRSKGKAVTVESIPVTSSERQLEDLTMYYLTSHRDRLVFMSGPMEGKISRGKKWYEADAGFINNVPRALAFLDLPPGCRLIPTAAEFASGEVVLLYRALRKKLLTSAGGPWDEYPNDSDKSLAELRSERRKYWLSFAKTDRLATTAMITIEEAASAHGRIHWIDYRLPLTTKGDTLHLHVCPAGNYDAGVFSYNFAKRAFKHGIRLVGTLKSEPDMNVLAIYDR